MALTLVFIDCIQNLQVLLVTLTTGLLGVNEKILKYF